MLQWALIFLVVAIIAGLLGMSGIAGAATEIAWILFLVGLVLAAVFYYRGEGQGSSKGHAPSSIDSGRKGP